MRAIRRLVLPLCVIAAAVSASTSTAGAAGATTVWVQGGTTISDSGLMANIIMPGFHKMFPQYKIKFVPVGTAVALCNAEQGLGDAVLTHNPSAEAQFVAGQNISGLTCGPAQASGSYSAYPFGRAVMYSDFVIVGPKSDPAGVSTNASANAAAAFQDIATAGASNQADFVSRGDGSGTNAKEATIWALALPANQLQPPPAGVTSGGIPYDPSTPAPHYPTWYHTTGQGQANNLQITNTCTTATFSSGNCYTLADRGTFNYLKSLGEVPNLKIVSQTNPSPAPGGPGLLNNLYHAYKVNDAVAPSTQFDQNPAGADAFLTYLQSPQFQTAVASYPTAANPAFHPDAYADINPDNVFLGASYNYGTSSSGETLTGNISSVVPFSAALSNAPVNVVRVTGKTTTPVASGNTDTSGNYSINFFPDHTGTYEIDFPQFKDLHETIYSLGVLHVIAGVTLQKTGQTGATVQLEGTAQPTSNRTNAQITIQERLGSGAWTTADTIPLVTSQLTFTDSVTLPSSGKWKLRARYTDPGVVVSGVSPIITVTVS